MRLYRNYSINNLPSSIAMDFFSWCSSASPPPKKKNIKKNFRQFFSPPVVGVQHSFAPLVLTLGQQFPPVRLFQQYPCHHVHGL